jgi:predicted ATP-dependent endonuclease of OLD family
MKICSIYIKGFQQFQDTFLDFTHPETGMPLEKICFIGSNGTGKSTILNIIREFLVSQTFRVEDVNKEIPLVIIKVFENNKFYNIWPNYVSQVNNISSSKQGRIFKDTLNYNEIHISNLTYQEMLSNLRIYDIGDEQNSIKTAFRLMNNSDDLVIYSPSESHQNTYLTVNDVPQTTVNEALGYFDNMPFYHEVSDQKVKEFWKMLVYLMKKRDSEQQIFENLPENLYKTKQQLLEEFENINPKILDKIAELWNKILAKAGLEFDIQNAKNPIQLNDNLKAYIKHIKSGEKIEYNQLSTGIRNFIFRIGHIYTLYFNRTVKSGFLMIDEPENSLFPDFLFDLMEIYESLVIDKNGNSNTQIFMATHNPIVAAQFEPHERIILDWGEEGIVKASKGKTPVGDDPNDILKNDFGIRQLMGKKGQEAWDEYLNLKKELRKTQNGNRDAIMDKITKIGSAYNFE